jgi:hypothetical protein
MALGGCWLNTTPAGEPVAPVRRVAEPLAPVIGVTTLSPDIVLAKIGSSYMGGVKRCYTVLLKNQPSARGKVTISFTVDASGSAQHGAARGFAGTVDACITALIAGWKFPIPKDRTGAPVEASFLLPLDLTPD